MDRIGAAFDASRDRPWPAVMEFLASLGDGTRVLDLAGGNGRHAVPASPRLRFVVADVARPLLAKAGERAPGLGLVEADMARLPFRARAFEHVLCAAGIHCVRGRSNRIAALKEARRVVEPGGRACFTVWARDQPRFETRLKEAAKLLANPGAPPPEMGDVVLRWGHDVDAPVDRFFHVYEAQEIAAELEEAGWKSVRVESHAFGSGARLDNHVALAYA